MKFAFIFAEKAHYPVAVLCEVLGVSRSGFYAWCNREQSAHDRDDRLLKAHVKVAFEKSKRSYGSPRIKEELRGCGIEVGRHRVARLMREQRLVARRRRRFAKPISGSHAATAENLLNRDFSASRPDEKWCGDVTWIPTQQGPLFLAMLMDLYSRRIIGWSVSPSRDTGNAQRALQMALATRRTSHRLIHHTDRGSEYTSVAYVESLERLGIRRSMSRRANCWDNAVAESFFSTMKTELKLATGQLLHRNEMRKAVVDYIAHYNLERRHSAIGYVSPVAYETATRIGRAV